MLNKIVNFLFTFYCIISLTFLFLLFVGFLFNFDVTNLKIALHYSLYPLIITFILCLLFGFKK